MSQKLPIRVFKWVDPMIDEVLTTPDDSDHGYILEVDLEYPSELHDLHNDYPLCPETISIKEGWLSQYQRELAKKTWNGL